jgi:DNA-directed RNA polymerase subunit RPC12/RpoP
MAVRMCPHCKTEIPAPEAAARSNDIVCPKCGARLEVASGSRMIAATAGLVAGTIAWRLSSGSSSDLGQVLPTLYAFLAFGIVSPLILAITANLRNAPPAPVASPAHEPVATGHGAGDGHAPAHH